MHTVPSGWYQDPQNPSALRWWNGEGWTDQTQLLKPSQAPNNVQNLTFKTAGGIINFDGEAITLHQGKKNEKQIRLDEIDSVRWLRPKGLGLGFVEVRIKGDDGLCCASFWDADEPSSDVAVSIGNNDLKAVLTLLDHLRQAGVSSRELTKEIAKSERAAQIANRPARSTKPDHSLDQTQGPQSSTTDTEHIVTIQALGATIDFDGQAITLRRGKKDEKRINMDDVDSLRWLLPTRLSMGFVEIRVKGDNRLYCGGSGDTSSSDNVEALGPTAVDSTLAFVECLQKVGVSCRELTKDSAKAERATHEASGLAQPAPPGLRDALKELGSVFRTENNTDDDESQRPLYRFTSHVEGKNPKVTIYSDRIEWEKYQVSGGKVAAGLMTGGMSLLFTGLASKDAGSDMIPIRALTSVSTRRDGAYWVVAVVAPGSVIEFRVSKSDAERAKNILRQLMLGTHPSQRVTHTQQPVSQQLGVAPPVTPESSSSAVNPLDQVMKLKNLLDADAITQDEFDVKKAQLLAQL